MKIGQGPVFRQMGDGKPDLDSSDVPDCGGGHQGIGRSGGGRPRGEAYPLTLIRMA